MKRLLFSHKSDVDGMGEVILSLIAFGSIDYILCKNVKELEEIFLEAYNNKALEKYDIIFMDIKDPVKFKLLVTLSFVPWAIYHFVLKSYTGAAFDALTVVTSTVTLIKMIMDSRKEKAKKAEDIQ